MRHRRSCRYHRTDAVGKERTRTLLVNSITIVCLALLVPTPFPAQVLASPPAEKEHPYYTIQVLSTSVARRDEVLKTCERLQRRGYVAYCQETSIRGQRYIRLRVGAFGTRAAALAYAREFAPREGFDYFVVRANVFADSFGDAFEVITTPGGIWLKSPTATKPLYRFRPDKDARHYGPARISPTGRAVAFYCDNKILKVDLADTSVGVLREERREEALFNTVLRWSPDGRHLAYLDHVGWELPTRLWVMQADGRQNRCLAGDEMGQTKVKAFLWHPRDNRLFYVAGPTHGTISVGGSLYRTDLTGRRDTIVAAESTKGMEVASDFRIAEGRLHYRLAHFDENSQVRQYTEHTLAITADGL